ncbi:MAG: hypothetical protein D3906_00120 [Candidatus Electrothrix sp. AUS1_2]|nr:hypothetical protein [Candidatus Electrothrix sp. AUS1_2]
MKDEFAATDFTFVSASPAESSFTATTVDWDNVGPLAPGEATSVIVNLRAKATGANKTANNEAIVEEGTAFFLDGRAANGDSGDVDITLRPAIDLSGTVFSDLGTLGVAYADGTDTLMSNVPVHLYACVDTSGIPLDPTTTSGNQKCSTAGGTWALFDTVYTDGTLTDGHNYIFEGVPLGYYYIAVDESGYVAEGNETYEPQNNLPVSSFDTCTTGLPKTNDACDGDWYAWSGGEPKLQEVAVIDSAVDTAGDVAGVDFGFQVDPGVSGYLWDDADGDGVWDDGEAPLTGVTVTLDSVFVTTDENGYYQFTGQDVSLTAGTSYSITVTTTSGDMAGDAWTETFEADGSANNSLTFTATAGTMLTDQNFGWTRIPGPLTVDGTVYYDLNINADQNDPTVEIGVKNAKVYLYQDKNQNGQIDPGEDGLVAETTTDENGHYEFTNLPDGDYLVVIDEASAGLDSYQQTEDPDLGTSVVCGGLSCDGDAKVNLSGTDDTDNDFGYQLTGPGKIGDFVWIDTDGDGQQDDGADSGIPGVTVTLEWDPDGDGNYTVLTTTTTSDGTTDLDGDNIPDPAGSYLFTGLPEGDYRVVVDTADTDLPTDAFGNSYSPSTNVQYDVSVTAGSATSLDNDFGFTPTGAIGDSVYWDVNGDGTQGTGEPGIENVTVKLYTFNDTNGNGKWDVGETKNPTGLTKLTDADGKYLFTGLEDGNYVVEVVSGTGTPIGTADLTADPDADGAVCPAAGSGMICDGQQGVTINGNSYMGADFGYDPPLFIGDQLFIDMDGDGSPMEENDLPLAYITVTLKDCGDDGICGGANSADDTVYTTETDENGNYAFVDGLVENHNYQITVDTGDQDWPTEYGELTASYNGHGDTTPDNSIELTLSSTPIEDADFGYKFNGANDLSGTICLEGTTSDGYCGINASSGDPLTNGIDPDAEVAYEGTTVYVSKWTDADGDGNVDAGELVPITQTVTDENGDYYFTGLPAVSGTNNESYLVSLEAPAALLELTTDLTDTPPDTPADALKEYTDSDGHTTSAWQSVIPGTDDTQGVDFAFQQTAAFDFGDLPLPFETTLNIDGARHVVHATPDLYLGADVTVEWDGQPSAGATADEDDGIAQSGTWTEGLVSSGAGGTVDVTAYGAGWLVGWIDFNGDGSFSGTGEMIINQAFGTSGESASASLSFDIPAGGLSSPGYARFRLFPEKPPVPKMAFKGIATNGEVEDYLFNLSNPSSIGDSILLDTDGNGVPDQGIEGAVVELQNEYCNAGVDCPTAVTDADGHYLFTGLGTGTYTVVVKSLPTDDLPAGTQQIYDPDSVLDAQTVVNITEPGTEYLDADFWYGPTVPTTGTIGDRIWNDADGDGVQDMGESGIGGITVILKDSSGNPVKDSNGVAITATTNPDGSYLLTDVPPGTGYIVEVSNPPSGATSTAGDNTTVDVAAGETILTADFGYRFSSTPTSNIGDTISYWNDVDDDGEVDSGELSGIAGVTVVLKDSGGNIIAQDVTDSNGNYLFPDLPPGTYTVEVTDTNGQLNSYVLNTYPSGTDTAGNPSYTLTTVANTNYLDIDFGYTDPVPTYATVSSFNAYVDADNQVVLEWTTASEVGTIGFLLERLNEQSGKYQAVTKQLLPGMLAPPHGGTYRYVDKSAKAGMSYTYQVVEVSAHDGGAVSGPYTVQANNALPVNNNMSAGGPEGYALTHAAFSRKQLKRFAARDTSEMKLAVAKKKQTGTTLKISVSRDGLVYLSAAELAAASGLTEKEVGNYVKSKKCLVTLAGTSVPVIAANTGSGLWFYGRAPERNDIGQNIYLLELGEKGVKMKNTPGRAEEVVSDQQSFMAHLEIEENHEPFHLYINTPVHDF